MAARNDCDGTTVIKMGSERRRPSATHRRLATIGIVGALSVGFSLWLVINVGDDVESSKADQDLLVYMGVLQDVHYHGRRVAKAARGESEFLGRLLLKDQSIPDSFASFDVVLRVYVILDWNSWQRDTRSSDRLPLAFSVGTMHRSGGPSWYWILNQDGSVSRFDRKEFDIVVPKSRLQMYGRLYVGFVGGDTTLLRDHPGWGDN